MEKTYERINWENYPSVVTPINEKNLNKMDQALDEVDNRVIGLDTAKLDKSTANAMVKDVSLDEETGIFTITFLNGTTKKFDTNLEKIAVNFDFNEETQKMILTLEDGTVKEVDLSSFISPYEFTDGDAIIFEVGSDGKVSANIKAGSITEDMLQPNFLADVKVEVEKAKNHSNSASNSSNEAKQYRDEAEEFRNQASTFVPAGYDELVQTVEENTLKIDTLLEKAGLEFNNTTKGSNIHLTDSADSNVVALELYGKTEQKAYTGKNLFDLKKTDSNINGIALTVDTENQCFSAIGTTPTDKSASITLYGNADFIKEKLKKGGTFVLSLVNATYDDSKCNISISYGYNGATNFICADNKPVTIPSGSSVSGMNLWVPKGTTINLSNVKIQLEENIVATEWERYVGGISSPNPDYPQEIKSVKGKNLLDCRGLTEQTVNNVTFTPVYDSNGNLEYINVNGTASANATYVIATNTNTLASFKKGKYILNGCPSGGGSSEGYRLQFWNYNGSGNASADIGTGTEFEFTVSSNSAITSYNVAIIITSGVTVSNKRFYPMIRPSSITDGTYVPYGLLRIKTTGKNLLDDIDVTSWYKPANSSVYRKVFKLKPNTEYTISQIKDSDSGSALIFILSGIDLDFTPSTSENGCTVGNSRTVTSSINGYITIGLYENSKGYCQLEEGTVATDYEPCKTSKITLSTPIELNGINGVYDVVTSDGVTRRFAGKRILSSDIEDIRITSNGNYVYTHELSDVKIYGSCLCTHFVGIGYDDRVLNPNSQRCYIDSETKIIYFRDNLENLVFTDLENAKTFFDENEVYLLYELATPTTEAMQNDFNALKTFYPETYISNDADCDMSVTYLADAKNYIDNKLALLEMALFNNI